MKRATITFATERRVISKGSQLPDADPLVKRHPHLFEPVPDKPKRSRARKETGADGDA